jgi:N-terminal domain of anti-restriction factor ArdC
MSRFHHYSFGNILEIARQRPTATRVAGMYAWNQLGRRVKKGEKGIRILAPIIGVKRKKDEEAERDITKQNTRILVGFRNAYVFDVEQTEGAELPAMREIHGTVGENRDRLISFIEAQGIELSFTEKIAPALGMSYGGKIAILPGQSQAEEFSTLVHELAHEMLHKAERRTATTKVVRETEAEAIAFVIGKAVGWRRVPLRQTISSYITATLPFSLKVWKLSSRRPASSWPHCSRRPQNRRRCRMQNWRRWPNANHPSHP